MSQDTWTVVLGLAWIACALPVLVVLIAGPAYALEVLDGVFDGLTRWRRVVIPWP